MLMLLCTVTAWAQTELPEITTDVNDIKWYVIKNTRSGKYAKFNSESSSMTQVATAEPNALFYFTASDAETADGFTPVIVHNYGTEAILSDFTKWDETGNAWFISTTETSGTSKGTGLHISKTAKYEGWNSWNDGGGNTITHYIADDAGSIFVFEKVTDFASIANEYKATILATLDDWATLTVVFDAALIADAKAAINAVTSTGVEACAAYDAELKKVTDAVAAKIFTFQTTATDAGRNGVWVSANASTMKAIGADTQDYNAIWSLRHAGGISFYMYNELNSVYMGAPSSNCPLTATPSVAYTFEIVDAANGIVEMKCNGETMHASNQTDNRLLNYDYNEAASRWYIRTIDVSADIQTIIDGLTEADYAEVPALGQYTKAAYDALVEARTSARTVSEVYAAIAAFYAAKNSPVFTIDGVIDYAAGKSIYDDSDAAPNFKVTNKYDKTMWWVFDQTTTTVGVTESVAVKNYATCNGFWGAEALKIAETSDAVEGNDDGIFLFYTVGSGTTLHYQNSGQVIVRYSATEANSGSATKFTYLGNTYDLDQLTDEKIAALAALQTAYDAKAFYADAVMGDGLGEYTGDKNAIVAALSAAETIGAKTLAEQAVLSIDDINAATDALNNVAALAINLPVQGKYYRIKGACDATLANYYITGNTNADGGRIACKAEADASTIFYYNDGKLLAYNSGLYIGLNSSDWTFSKVDGSKAASTITFAGSPRVAGAYTVNSAGRYLHYSVYGETVEVNRCSEDIHAEHDWTLEEVTTLPVTVTEAGYATFFAPVEVTVPAGDVTAHTVTVDGEWASLSETLTTIPANTGVVLANAGTVELAINYEGTAAAIEGNVLAGTAAKSIISIENGSYYILAKPEGAEVAGLYTPKNGDDKTTFINGSHKAYMHLAAEGAAYYSFRFPGTTGIEEVTTENGNVKAIYDLTGRRVEAITAPGIYIVNGKKVLVK